MKLTSRNPSPFVLLFLCLSGADGQLGRRQSTDDASRLRDLEGLSKKPLLLSQQRQVQEENGDEGGGTFAVFQVTDVPSDAPSDAPSTSMYPSTLPSSQPTACVSFKTLFPSAMPSSAPTSTPSPTFKPTVSTAPSNSPSESMYPSEQPTIEFFGLPLCLDFDENVFPGRCPGRQYPKLDPDESDLAAEGRTCAAEGGLANGVVPGLGFSIGSFCSTNGRLENNASTDCCTCCCRIVDNLAQCRPSVECSEDILAVPPPVPAPVPARVPPPLPVPVPAPVLAPVPAPVPDPTSDPTSSPSPEPTADPSPVPTATPSDSPSAAPVTPSASPSAVPSLAPSVSPSASAAPSTSPSASPVAPSAAPSSAPSTSPSAAPSSAPSGSPTKAPADPSEAPSSSPTAENLQCSERSFLGKQGAESSLCGPGGNDATKYFNPDSGKFEETGDDLNWIPGYGLENKTPCTLPDDQTAYESDSPGCCSCCCAKDNSGGNTQEAGDPICSPQSTCEALDNNNRERRGLGSLRKNENTSPGASPVLHW